MDAFERQEMEQLRTRAFEARKAALLEAAAMAEGEAKRLDREGMTEADSEMGDGLFRQAICLEVFAALLRARAEGE